MTNADHQYDVVVVGTGATGLAAAVSAADSGATVLLVERSDLLGGVTAVSGGELWAAATHVAAAAGVEDDLESAEQYLDFLSGGFRDKALQCRLLTGMAEAFRYFEERAGLRWQLYKGAPDNYYGVAPGSVSAGRGFEVEPIKGEVLGEWSTKIRTSAIFPPGVTLNDISEWGGLAKMGLWDWESVGQRMDSDLRTLGGGLVAYFVKAALVDRGIPVLFDARANRIVADASGRVTGLVLTRDGKEETVLARRGVILATGGYDWDHERLSATDMPDYHSSCPPIVTGDHLRMAGALGAEIASLPANGLISMFGFNIPGEEVEGQPMWRYLGFEAALPHGMLVNRRGERFTDESFVSGIGTSMRIYDAKHRQYANLPAFLIVDNAHRSNYPMGTYAPGMPLPEPPFKKADSITELADKLGIDAEGLETTVNRLNAFAAKGVDDDFGRGSMPYSNHFMGDLACEPNPNLGSIATAPYYGLELTVGGVGINSSGLRTDDQARVLHVEGQPIPGLYAAGNAAIQFDVGPVYQSGLTITRGLVWGYVAGRHAGGAA